jgi:BMFP domain-containing protein YqiC
MATRTKKPTREAIMEIVDKLPDDICEDLLSYLEDIDLYTPEMLKQIREAEEEIARGDVVTQEEFEAKYAL